MKAMILAAGVGSRLKPLTLFMPKPMVPIVNKPVMEYIVELLARHDIKEIVANLWYMPHTIEQHFGDGRRWGVHITYSLERELLGTAGAVRRVASHFDNTFLVMMGDAITDLDLSAAVDFHRRRGAKATICLHRVSDPSRYGVVQVDESGRILNFQEKPAPEEALSDLVSMGVYILEPSVLDLIPVKTVYDFGHQLFPRLLAEGAPFYGYESACYWSDVGKFDEYRQAQHAILGNEVQGVQVPGRQVSEGVWQGRGVIIHRQAQIVPPVVIGDNCQIRADAIVGPETVLGHNVIVDEGATVVGSAVLDGTYVGRLVNVQEAVVNRNCLVSVPAATSVYVADRFLLGDVSEERLWKGVGRAAEWAAAFLLFLLTLPFWPLAALLARLSGPGSLLTKEPCVTAGPQTPQEDEQASWRVIQTARFRSDPARLAGRLLRRLGLDALPRLIGVLRGDIALVGVSPITPQEAEGLDQEWQRQRFTCPVGLTGLWYVSGSDDAQLEERLITDSYYAVTRTWREDLRVLWQTPGAWWRRLRSAG